MPGNIKWPLQSQCNVFYGNPDAPGFEAANIIRVSVPFAMYYGTSKVTKIAVHKKCAGALSAWLEKVWENAGHSQQKIHEWGMDKYGGSFVVRQKRGGSTPSMHSYGCAFDFDPASNAFGDDTPHFSTPDAHTNVVQPFKDLGGVWGGDWHSKKDGMHFQFAVVG